MEPRTSDPDRRHLLDTASIAPSESASMAESNADTIIFDSNDHNHTTTLLQSSNGQTSGLAAETLPSQTERGSAGGSYRGFASRQAYIAALHAWAEEKKYVDVGGAGLVGFYGNATLDEMAARPPPSLGVEVKGLLRRLRGKKKKDGDGRTERRATVG